MARSIRSAVVLTLSVLGACAEGVPIAGPYDGAASFAKAKPQSNPPVTVSITDAGMQIRSDGTGAYTNSSGVSSIIQSIGAWVLDATGSSTRAVVLDFSQPIGTPSVTPATASYHARMISKCNLVGKNMLTMAVNEVISCPLHIRFDYAGGSYAVQMNPGASAADPEGSAPASNYAIITCLTGSPCTAWRAESQAGGNAGGLLKYTTAKGKTTAALQGYYTFSFLIGVTKS